MAPKLEIQASNDVSVDPGEIRGAERSRSSVVLVLLLGFVQGKKRQVSHFTDSEEKLSGYTEGTVGKNSAEAILFLRSAESAGQERKHQALTHS